jgi:3-methylfumaryl-CoA hydratase
MTGAIDIDFLRGWIGREEVAIRRASADLETRFGALLDRDPSAPLPAHIFPVSHWLHFLPPARHSEIDSDGHPRRGGFLPPVPLPRRMWAGSRVRFLAPIPVDAMMEHRSVIADVRHKGGATGDLVFVTVHHRIVVDGITAIEDEQDIVYRTPPAPGQAAAPLGAPVGLGDLSRRVTPDTVMLFRHSALMFNGHRIHYDRDYARDVEGYAGLVVQGPLVAALLLDHFLTAAPDRPVARFAFRAQRPLLDTAPFDLCLGWTETGARLWTRDAEGQATMTAEVAIAG